MLLFVGDTIGVGHFLYQLAECLLDERETFARLHGAGDIDEENKITRRPFVGGNLAAF